MGLEGKPMFKKPYEHFTKEDMQESFETIVPRLEAFSTKLPSEVTEEELETLIEGVDRVDGIREADYVWGALIGIRSALFRKTSDESPDEAMQKLRATLKQSEPSADDSFEMDEAA